MSSAAHLSVAAIARATKKVRILSIGSPIAQRPDPLRVAEEIALADVMSRGRHDAGLIKSVPWEYFNSNANPMGVMDRFWEAHDLIIKALSTRDGPFSWAGEYFHYRNVNIVPRPYQDPCPPIWITGTSPSSARSIAARGHIAVTSQSGTRNAAPYYDAYRDEYQRVYGKPAPSDRLAYLCYMAVGRTEGEARAIAERIHPWVVSLGSQNNAYQYAAGYAPAADFARVLRAGNGGVSPYVNYKAPSIDKMRDDGVFFFGTPTQVFDQIRTFVNRTAKVGHLLMQMGGFATKKDTIDCMTLVANELRPRLEELAAQTKEAA
jgi:alkanesulfonate monooxygenase SsuD/methylene tetrahydromethanopterin reductase-like flavin-dependent oxidoreductase (luciferase family)